MQLGNLLSVVKKLAGEMMRSKLFCISVMMLFTLLEKDG